VPWRRGFKELAPNFAIRDAGNDENRLPTSSTCVNLLKVSFAFHPSTAVAHGVIQLPRYKSEEVLREKLLQAITAGAGFDLS
jgi:ubiquitin-protein ligase E3 C